MDNFTAHRFRFAREIGYLSPEDHRRLTDELTEITKMLHSLHRVVSGR